MDGPDVELPIRPADDFAPPAPATCHAETDAWCGARPAQQCEYERLGLIDRPHEEHTQACQDIKTRYSEACPDLEAIRQIVGLGPIIELGAGNGYWAHLLRKSGGDVLAFDRELRAQTWSDVLLGDQTVLAEYADRTLLFVMPPRPGFGSRVLEHWPGSTFVLVSEGPFPNLGAGWEGDGEAAITEGGWQRQSVRRLPEVMFAPMNLSVWHRDR